MKPSAKAGSQEKAAAAKQQAESKEAAAAAEEARAMRHFQDAVNLKFEVCSAQIAHDHTCSECLPCVKLEHSMTAASPVNSHGIIRMICTS